MANLQKRVKFPSTIRIQKEGLLPDARRTSSGYRIYDDGVLEYIRLIKIGQMLGFKLHELPALMQNGKSLDHDTLLRILDNKKAELDAQITQLQSNSDKIDKLKQELVKPGIREFVFVQDESHKYSNPI